MAKPNTQHTWVDANRLEYVQINDEGISTFANDIHIKHFILNDGDNKTLYLAHKGTHYYEKINSVINSGKNVLMTFLPEEEIQKILDNPGSMEKVDLNNMKISAMKKTEDTKEKIENIQKLFNNAGVGLTPDDVQNFTKTIQKGDDTDNLMIELINNKLGFNLTESHVEDLMNNIDSIINLGSEQITTLLQKLSKGKPIDIILPQ